MLPGRRALAFLFSPCIVSRMTRILVFLLIIFLASPAYATLNGDVLTWLSLREASRSYDLPTYTRFLNAHPDWPENTAITLRAEQILLRKANDNQVLDWCRAHAPVTDDAKLRYITALTKNNQHVTAKALLKENWRRGAFTSLHQDLILSRFGGVLTTADHEERLNYLLWHNNLDRAEKAMAFVTSNTARSAAVARIKLQRNSNDALPYASGLSGAARNDNGVLFDLARYQRQHDQDDRAVQNMARRKAPPGDYAPQWWRERNLLARRALEHGDYKRAYELAKTHGAIAGAELAEAEFLAGWVADTRLKAPGQALPHFQRMLDNVKTPISVARAAYWAGIAAGQLGRRDDAGAYYRQAARHMNTFYGQLAAYALNQPGNFFAAYFKRNQRIGSAASAALRSDLIGAARILNGMGRGRERDEFLRAALREATLKNAPQAVIPVAKQLGSPSMALVAAKAAYEKNILIGDALFPTVAVPPTERKVESSLVLGVIRQESLFDPKATSPANARGLMQVLPGTARQVAQQDGLLYNNEAQLYQPAANIKLGQAYLARLLQRYDGFIPLAVAAYNAGPGNVDKWLVTMGDPRRDPYSWIDWVERIPFYETRNYVQRVWENYTVYKYMKGGR